MIFVEIVFVLFGAYVAVWAVYVSAIPVIASLCPQREPRNLRDSNAELPSIVVIVPSHNMSEFVVRCIRSLLASEYPLGRVGIYVVADHCTDDTAELAADAGANVLFREEGLRGKTYTLAWAIEALGQRGVCPDLYVIVDATARVDRAFLKALAERWRAGEDIIIGRAMLDTENQQWFAQCLGLTLAHRNLQNSARERLGLSAFVSGRGMGYSRAYIERYGWSLALPNSTGLGKHPTEDWRHGVQIAAHGLRAAFAEDAIVITPLRGSLVAATEQGVRWERGRMANAATYGLVLLRQGMRQRSLPKLVAAFDSIQPPVAILAGLSLVVATFSWLAWQTEVGYALGFIPLVLIIAYALMVLNRGRQEGIKVRTILWAPIYVAWRCLSFIMALGNFGRSRNLVK